jgi:hypothetical protein
MERTMNMLMISGAILALLGLTGLAIPVFATHQTTEVAKIGDLKIDSQENTLHTIPPLLSGGALVLGIILIGGGLYQRR